MERAVVDKLMAEYKGDALDWNYITKQCKQPEIADFERERRQLAINAFSSDTLPNLTESEQELLMFYLTAGTYCTFENGIKRKLKDQSEASFWIHSKEPSAVSCGRSMAQYQSAYLQARQDKANGQGSEKVW